MSPRISPLEPPFDPEVDRQLATMMPPGVPPIGLFRALARNLPMAESMGGWGAYELSKRLSLSMRDREIVIDRICARCRCEYEWGVHLAFFAERVGLDTPQRTSLTHGTSSDPCWTEDRERVLIDMADALHDDNDIDDTLWDRATAHLDERQLLDTCMLAGWYHAISFTANAARVPLEAGAPRFRDYSSTATEPRALPDAEPAELVGGPEGA